MVWKYSETPVLANSLTSIREPRQRVFKLIHWIKERSDQDGAAFLTDILSGGREQSEMIRILQLDLIRYKALLFQLGYEKLSSLYSVAKASGSMDVCELLQSDTHSFNEPEDLPSGYATKLKTLTMGERRERSRKSKRKDLEILLFDPSSRVIGELLKNPHIVERDVVRVASRHQAPVEVIEEILKSDRWMSCYSVVKALIFNPRTPVTYARAFLRQLRKADLALILQGGTKKKALILEAKKLMAIAGSFLAKPKAKASDTVH